MVARVAAHLRRVRIYLVKANERHVPPEMRRTTSMWRRGLPDRPDLIKGKS